MHEVYILKVYLAHRNSKYVTNGRSKHRNNSRNEVKKSIKEREYEGESPKQGLTSVKVLTVMLL